MFNFYNTSTVHSRPIDDVDLDIDMDDDEGEPSSAQTIVTSNEGTPAPSIYSYSSSRDGRVFLREIAGRTLNAQNDLYLLPADEFEHLRLDKQHIVHLASVGGLYMAKQEVERALAPAPGIRRAILDLGCGGGIWATSMAQEFPHAQVVGVDLAPSTSRPPPANCRFEFDDFTLGLEHYYGQFDVVHSRATANGVKDFKWFVAECTRCLRYGGVLIMIEGNFELMNEDKEPQDIAFGDGGPGQSWLARMCFEAYNTYKSRGSAVDAGIMLDRWLKECPDLADVSYEIRWIPIGPWEDDEDPEKRQTKILMGTAMRQNMKEFARSLAPSFISNGYPPDLIGRFIEGADKELDELSVHMYLRYYHCWARRVTHPDPNELPAENTFQDGDVDVAEDSSSSPQETTHDGLPASPQPPRRAIPIRWKLDPSTGERILDTASLAGSLMSLGSKSMSISTT